MLVIQIVNIADMDLTASELTKWAKMYFQVRGYRINRVNNIPVRRRKGTIEKGWADLQGYTSSGIYVACEIKTIKDKLSVEQIERLRDVITCGGLAYICTQLNGVPTLIPYQQIDRKE